MLTGIDNCCHCEEHGILPCDVAISWNAVRNEKMFDEWYDLVCYICHSAYLIVPLYREIATSALWASSQ